MDSYNKFLAENVLTEDKVVRNLGLSRKNITATDLKCQVTYRLLSRALQVHVNTAKQYDLTFISYSD